MCIDNKGWVLGLVLGLFAAAACTVEVDGEDEDRLRLAHALEVGCAMDADAALDAVETVEDPGQELAETPKCLDDEGHEIDNEADCHATQCGPPHDRTDCFWMGSLRGCRCPSGQCGSFGTQ